MSQLRQSVVAVSQLTLQHTATTLTLQHTATTVSQPRLCDCVRVYVCQRHPSHSTMWWLRLACSMKLQASFAQ